MFVSILDFPEDFHTVVFSRLHRILCGLNQKIQAEIDSLQLQINEHLSSSTSEPTASIDLEKIRTTLNQWIDFSTPILADALIDQFILQVVVIDDNTFNWTLDLTHGTNSTQNLRMSPSQIALQLYRDKQHTSFTDTQIDTVLSHHITNPQELFSFTITADDAAAYCKSIGLKFFRKKWTDKKVIISI